jgi:hypothetical protein
MIEHIVVNFVWLNGTLQKREVEFKKYDTKQSVKLG